MTVGSRFDVSSEGAGKMARIKIVDIIDRDLSIEIKSALEFAVKNTCPGVVFNTDMLFRNFVSEVRRLCRTWEQVSDSYVESSS
jgi:hypothetical protein